MVFPTYFVFYQFVDNNTPPVTARIITEDGNPMITEDSNPIIEE